MKTSTLIGWRSRAWSWVLFLALFKGLVPQVALASMLMSGDPAAILCGSNVKALSSLDATAAMKDSSSQAHCACASASDGAASLVLPDLAPVLVETNHLAPLVRRSMAMATQLPPACGPPA